MAKKFVVTAILLLAVTLVTIPVANAGIGRIGKGKCLRADLTEEQLEQLAEIRETVKSMKEEGATREEIRAAIAAKFEEWGIELPEPQNNRRRISRRRIGRNGPINPLIMAELAIIDAEQDDGEVILAAPQAPPYKTSEITTWGKLKVAR